MRAQRTDLSGIVGYHAQLKLDDLSVPSHTRMSSSLQSSHCGNQQIPWVGKVSEYSWGDQPLQGSFSPQNSHAQAVEGMWPIILSSNS